MDKDEIIRNIKKELRANMNGVASKYMRENGLTYHLNWGIELPRLQQIAREFEQNQQVAQALWHENVRECKILAGMLAPATDFLPEVADIWVDQIPTPEIAQLTVMNLFSKVPYASRLAFAWMADEGANRQLCGFLILTRLLMQGGIMNERSEEEFLDQAAASINTNNLHLRKAVANALAYYAQIGEEESKKAEQILANCR